MKSKLIIILLFIAACGVVWATGSAESGSPDGGDPTALPATVTRIGTLRGPTSVGMAPLIMQPERLQPLIEPQFRILATPDLLVSQILAGEIDIAALPTNLAANLYNRGADLRFLGVSGGGVLYVVADGPLDWGDLPGRTVHTLARGATPDILFQALAREHGLTPGVDFEIRYSADQTELAQQLIAGRVNLAVLPEPFVTRVTQANPSLQIVMDLGDSYREFYGGDTYPMTAMVVSGRFADDHPEALRAFTDAYREGLAWFRENRRTGAEAVADQIGIPALIIVNAFDRLNMTFVSAQDSRDGVHQLLEIFHAFNPQTIGGRLPDEDFYK